MAEKILQALMWILPGLLFLVVLILMISATDRRSRTNRPGEDRTRRKKS